MRNDSRSACRAAKRERYWSCFFFSSRRRHTRCLSDWSSDVCSSDLVAVSMTLSPIHDRRGAITGMSAIGRDIAPLLSAQSELEQRQRKIASLLEQAEERSEERRVGKECAARWWTNE